MKYLKTLYTARQLPVFQNRIFDSEAEALNCPKGDLVLVQDLKTGLIFNQAFDPSLMAYDASYQNEQAVSSFFKKHLSNVIHILGKHFTNSSLIEVGCGKGYFLESLSSAGFDVIGLDPAYEGENPRILKQYFTPELKLSADGIILRHVLEHIQNPINFLINLRESNSGKGKIYIEVPCFDWICKHSAWFDIFYEHVNYFRMSDFKNIFSCIYDSGYLFEGQYLYVIAELSSLKNVTGCNINEINLPEKFINSVDGYANSLKLASQKHRTSAIWGGSSKGVIFALFMQRAGAMVDFVIDLNPHKHGKYLPATGLRVSSPDVITCFPDDTDIFVMNSNYVSEIKQMSDNRFNYITVDS